MKIHKINLENNYRNLVDSAIAVKAGLTPAVFAARPTYNDVLLGFNDGETPTLLLPKWAQFTIDLSKNKPSWAPASLTGTLTVTITPSVVGVTAEEDEVTLGNVDVYGVPVASTGKQYKVNEGFYSIGLNVMVVNEDNVPVIAYSDGRPMKVAMQKVADNGPDTSVDVAAGGGGSFTQEQADWNQSDDTAVDFIKNKPTIPAAQVNADWNAESGVAQILNKPTIPAAQVNADWNATSGVSEILNKPTIPAAQVNADWNATSGVSEILNKPTIPTVNDATLTFTQDGETLATFSANASTNVEVEIPAGGGGGGASIIEKTWSELKALRDGGTLTPGQQYRITDYVFTSTKSGVTSANHPFDIIVTADSASSLNEVARAALHAGDTYFANCKLNSWKLWYCLDNDTTKFNWADSTNGKGVIYRMIDEWNNDCPYDFKNVKIYGTYMFYDSTGDGSLNGASHDNKVCSTFNGSYFEFKIVKFGASCYENIVGPFSNNITFGGANYRNEVGANCSSITLGASCYNNTIMNNCMSINLAAYAQDNNLGHKVKFVDFGQQCTKNTIGVGCERIKFGTASGTAKDMTNVTVEAGNQYIYLDRTTSTTGTWYQNVTIAKGVNTTSTWLTISDANVNQAYQTTFFKETDGTLKKQEGSAITTYTPPA